MKKTVRTALLCLIACVLAITGAFSIAPPTFAAAATEGAQAAADPITTGTWKDWGLDDTTQNVGRIWTDKSVSAGDIDLTGAGGTMTIQKGDSDFLTAFSALSSTSNLRDTVTTPLDIVLVLDASGSMDDAMGGGDRTKRIDALKVAANSFIDKIAESNGKISDESQRHRVSIVKFSGKKRTAVGNDTYRSDGYTYNYSQVMKNMTTVDSSGKKSLEDTVNSIKPAGSTRADYGLELASSQFASNDRTGATKVVVFFTDGAPTSTNGFESGVADAAVSAAKSMKDSGTTIYTIGIFGGANPGDTSGRQNSFMNAVSSNYPKATAYNKLGDRASAAAAYYKTATTSDDLKTLFEDISQEILKSSGYPTEIHDGFEDKSGYVTFTDQLGDYMKVDDFRCIVFAKQVFSAHTKTTSGNVDTYTFSGSAQTALYPAGDLSSVVIEVRRAKDARTGDHVTVKIPASLIPLRAFEVDAEKGTGSATLTFPIRVFFGSSLKDEVADLLASADADMSDYLAHHTAADGRVEFLANAWSGGDDGNACASFTPAASNGYYYIHEDTPVYEDAELSVRAAYPLQGGKTYYYGHAYWDLAADGSVSQKQFVAPLSGDAGSNVAADATGKAYLKAGTPRLTYINELHAQKADNVTATASSFIDPRWNGSQIFTWLGNNGKLTLERPGSLEISKVVELPDGYEADDFADEEFEFAITVPEAAGKNFTGTVTLGDEVQGNENFSLSFDEKGTYRHTLRPGEKLTIKGLCDGWAYKVEETARDGWTAKAVGDEGAISAAEAAEVEFDNTYAATGTLEGKTALAGTKVLDGRAWRSEDQFAFILTAEHGAPMPEGAQDGTAVMYVTASEGTTAGTEIPFEFGDIAYTRPGTYTYTIHEAGADDGYDVGILGGVSVSKATYRVTVEVTDHDHGGRLTVVSTMERMVDDAGNALGEDDHGETVGTANFRNVYEIADAGYAGITVSKVLSGRAMTAGEFNFTIEGTDDASKALLVDSDRSFTNGAAASGEKSSMKKLDGLRFTKEDAGKTYTFTVRETVPEDAGKLPGVAYDKTEHEVEISVADAGDGTLTVVTKVDGQEGNEVAFENAYAAAPLETEVDFGLTKRLEGRGWTDDDAFTFEIAAIDSAPLPTSTTTFVTKRDLNADGTAPVRFGKIRFTSAGAYEYEVREQKAGKVENGMTYSTNVAHIRVTVVDHGAGSLVATPSLVSGSNEFVNSYGVELDYNAKGGLAITKKLEGASAAEGVFSFIVTAEGEDVLGIAGTYDSPRLVDGVAATVAATKDEIVFTQADAGKTWNYTVMENAHGTGFTCECATWNISVSVADDPAAGRLSVTTTATGGDASRTWTYTSDADGADPAIVKFVNRYAASGATADIYGTKELTGRPMADGEFSFELAYAAQPANVVARAQNQAGGVDFGKLGYTTEGLAELVADGLAAKTDTGWSVGYVAREVTDGLSGRGITASASSFSVTVNITDAGNGTLTCSVEYPEGGLAFRNEYQAADATIGLTATKTLLVPDGLAGPGDIAGKFTFTVTGEDGARTPEHSTATNDASGTVNFGNITFTLENTFGGAVAMAADEESGAVVDEGDTAGVEVKVTEQGGAAEGDVLLDTPVISENDSPDDGKKDDGKSDAATPVDAAEPNAEPEGQAEPEAPLADVPVVKEVPAESVEPEASVARWVYCRGNALRRASAERGAAEADPVAPTDKPTGPRSRVFHYVVTESGSLPGVANDPDASRDVYIKVTDDGEGRLTAEIVESDDLTFKNSYSASATTATINAHKVLEGRDLAAGEFEFLLLDADGKTVRTARNAADGSVTFDAIEYSAPGAYTYTIAEGAGNAGGVTYDGRRHEVKVTVSDNGAGKLVADVEYRGGATFVNTYKASPADVAIVAKKVLKGTTLTKGRFTFVLKGTVNDEPVELTVTNDAEGNVVFPNLKFASAGTYTFTVSEVAGREARVTYDKRAFTVTVEVTDDGSGKLSATVSNDAPEGAMVFVNTYTPPATPPVTPPTQPSTPTPSTTVKTRTTGRPVPQTGDASASGTTAIAAATVGLALLATAARLARRRAKS